MEGPEYLSRKGFEALKSIDSKPPADRFRRRKRGTLRQKRTVAPYQISHFVEFFFKYFIGEIRSVFGQIFSLGESVVFSIAHLKIRCFFCETTVKIFTVKMQAYFGEIFSLGISLCVLITRTPDPGARTSDSGPRTPAPDSGPRTTDPRHRAPDPRHRAPGTGPGSRPGIPHPEHLAPDPDRPETHNADARGTEYSE